MCKGGCKETWKGLSTLVKVLIFCVIFMSIAVVIFFALFLTSLPKKDSGSDSKENQGNATTDDRHTHHDQIKIARSSLICETQACKEASQLIRSKIDPSVNPCDDFYQFSCGKWLKNTQLKDDDLEISSETPFGEKVNKKLIIALEKPIHKEEEFVFKILQTFYKGCMDIGAMEKRNLTDIKDLINGIGGWPVVAKDQWKEDQFSWTNATYYFFDRAGEFLSYPLVALEVKQDLKNSSAWIIEVGPPEVQMREEFVEGITNPSVIAYKETIIEIAKIFGAEKTAAEKELFDVVEFKIKFTNITVNILKNPISPVETDNFTFVIEDLEEMFPFIPWLEYVKAFMPKHTKITKNYRLIANPLFFEDVGQLINDTSKRTMANYIISEVIWKLSSFIMNKQFLNAMVQFETTLNSLNLPAKKHSKNRQEKCLNALTTHFPQLIGALYVRDFKGAHRKVLQDMLKGVLEVYTETMTKIDWMDEKTKKFAIEKVKAIRNVAVYFPDQKNYSLLNKLYEPLEFDDKRILLSFANASKHYTNLMFDRLGHSAKKHDSFHFDGNILSTSPLYHPTYNRIVVQAGSMHMPWFDADLPKYLNYGSIGVIIGHEYTHGFDVSGSVFDKDGNLMSWWVPATFDVFLNKTHCYIEQYDKYPMDVNSTLKVNGSNTLDENIADNGGIKLGFLAYQAWVKKHGPEFKLPDLDFTPTQLYFISFAHIWCAKYMPEYVEMILKDDEHAPGYARVLGPVQNSEFFAREFGCPVNSPMNPSHKCGIW